METFFAPFSSTSTATATSSSSTLFIATSVTSPFSSFSTSAAMTTLFQPSTGTYSSSPNSWFSINEPASFPSTSTNTWFYYPAQFMPPYHQSLQFRYPYPLEQAGQSSQFVDLSFPFWFRQTGIGFGVPSSIQVGDGVQGSFFPQPWLTQEQQRRILDAQRAKVARMHRRMVRQRSRSLRRSSSSVASSSVPSTNEVQRRRQTVIGGDADVQNRNNNVNRDLYDFCTPDNRRLRVLLKKELKNSDVGTLGRIILPKREAEENLPNLSDKEGILLGIRDVYSERFWIFRYKYWINNKSRMYVLEDTGEFVKENGLENIDSLTLYEDESKNLYYSITKAQSSVAEQSNPVYTPYTNQARDDQEAESLALLMEQLKHNEHQDANNLMTFTMDFGSSSSYNKPPQEAEVDAYPHTTLPPPPSPPKPTPP